MEVAGENIVALCDVNGRHLDAAAKKFPGAKTFADFRQLYAEMKDFDAAVVSTAMAMPTMPKKLPRIELVGWLRPFSAWMKQTLATKYSSVTRFMLISSPRR